MSAVRFLDGNRVALLCNGEQFFPALESAIDAATFDIHLETYIYEADSVGERIGAALIRAAQRGVCTRLLLDGVGSARLPAAFMENLRSNGVHLRVFRPERRWLQFRRSRLRRLHRKIALVDGKVGFVGGINIVDDFSGVNREAPQFDYAVRVEGPLLAPLYKLAEHLWRVLNWSARARSYVHAEGGPPPSAARTGGELAAETARQVQPMVWPVVHPVRAGDQTAGLAVRDNFRHRRSIEHFYIEAIHAAQHDIVIANAYFLPGRHFRHALVRAARRGVKVTLLLQGRSDHPFLVHTARALYAQFLGAGISITEYSKSMLHAKVAVFDGEIATVGSSNLDPFSLMLAREANVVVRDPEFGRQLRESLEAARREGGVELDPHHWGRRNVLARMLSWLGYEMARMAAGLAGLAREWR